MKQNDMGFVWVYGILVSDRYVLLSTAHSIVLVTVTATRMSDSVSRSVVL